MDEPISILCVEPDELYREVFLKVFANTAYDLRFAEIASLRDECRSFTEDLLLINIELPGLSAFELFHDIRENHSDVPVVFFTESNVDQYLLELMKVGQTNVVAKPFTKEELLFLVDKLLHKSRAFGLKNYLKPGSTVKTFFINCSNDIREYTETVLRFANKWGFDFHYDFKIDLVIHELLINALYHAHGYEEQKKHGTPIVLPDGEFVEIEIGRDENRFGIAITDYAGALTRKIILDSLYSLDEQHKSELRLKDGEKAGSVYKQHGRGIDIVRKNCGEYYFVIEPYRRTQAIIIFDKNFEKDDEYTSIKVIEV